MRALPDAAWRARGQGGAGAPGGSGVRRAALPGDAARLQSADRADAELERRRAPGHARALRPDLRARGVSQGARQHLPHRADRDRRVRRLRLSARVLDAHPVTRPPVDRARPRGAAILDQHPRAHLRLDRDPRQRRRRQPHAPGTRTGGGPGELPLQPVRRDPRHRQHSAAVSRPASVRLDARTGRSTVPGRGLAGASDWTVFWRVFFPLACLR